ncbi:phage holin family protein [Arthrobacter sp. M4]|uniref:phage holin family protein n=1 Tax=Arthrobacter sp. M4 TaxID=218160 RepID=UPI001CDC3E11|nr:phage holin family protein [Arthrobacter sp. M4]MCA4133712.1 phage holin family protein [Arthrobacter sp. M4]
MTGRHSSRTNPSPRLSDLPENVKLAIGLLPRQLNDEVSLAKAELKDKGKHLGVAGAALGIAVVFLSFLVVALIVAAILGLATVMPGWLAALVVGAVFLLIVAVGALTGTVKFKQAMPMIPEKAIRGLKHDLGIVKEGSSFDAAILDPNSPQALAAKAAKEAKAAQAKAEKAAKAAHEDEVLGKTGPAPTEEELLERLGRRRTHLTEIRDELGVQLDAKTQGEALLKDAQRLVESARTFAAARLAAAGDAFPPDFAQRVADRWKALAAFAASATVVVVVLRRLLRK